MDQKEKRSLYDRLIEQNFSPQSSSAEYDALRKRHLEEGVDCFGGRLFRSHDRSNRPVLSFAAQGMSQEEIDYANDWYNTLGRLSFLGFLHRTPTPPAVLEQYTVFDFEINPQDQSLHELLSRGAPVPTTADQLMNQLIRLLQGYNNALAETGQSYQPLCCLSRYTVLLGGDNRPKVLPLLAFRGKYPAGTPSEVIRGEAVDARSDLYCAAYAAVEAESGNHSGGALIEPRSELLRACLKSVRDWRPNLGELSGPAAPKAAADTPHPYTTPSAPNPAMDPNGNRGEGVPLSRTFLQIFGVLRGAGKRLHTLLRSLEEPETPLQTDDTLNKNTPADYVPLRPEEGEYPPDSLY